jgi:hypothetical protein
VKSEDRPLLAVLAAALLVWAWVCVPTLLGVRTFYLRDVFLTHLPLKAFGASELAAGRIPAFNPTWGLGQPFRGNPNALAFYPDNLFYLALPFWSAFNLHFALHWLLALAGMAALAREMGQGKAAALLAGMTYAGSGWMLSALTFYNTLTVAAWWPLVILGAVRGGRRGIALGGIACGFALLGGEPVTAALGLLPLLLAAVSRHGWRRGSLTAVAVGALGMVIALPQVVATLRVLPFTVRGGQGVSAAQAVHYTLHPARFLELILPFPFGWPAYIGRHGIWNVKVLPDVPLFFSLYAGILAVWLAAAAARRHRGWALLALAGPVTALLAGMSGDLLVTIGFGLFRFPEKFVFWLVLALPLLAGWGLERAISEGLGRWRKLAAVAGGLFLVLAGVATLAGPFLVAGVERTFAANPPGPTEPATYRPAALALLRTQIGSWQLALAVAGAALVLGFLITRPRVPRARQAVLLAGLQLATLLQLYPLATTDETAPYRKPSAWAGRLGPGTAVLDETLAVPPWEPDPPYHLPDGPRTVLERLKAEDLSAAPGVLHGLTYPLAPDLEGMHTLLFKPMLDGLPALQWEERSRWFRATGLQAAVLFEEPNVPALRLLDTTERYGVTTRLYAVANPAPPVWWPRTIVPAATPEEAFALVSRTPDPVAAVAATTQQAVPHDPAGRVRLISASPDRIEIETEGNGGVAVIRRAWQPLFIARTEGRRLSTLPVNLNLLGVLVPAGRHRMVVEVSAWPEILAGCIALLALGWAVVAMRPQNRGRLAALAADLARDSKPFRELPSEERRARLQRLRGAGRGLTSGSGKFARRKQEEIEIEERKFDR